MLGPLHASLGALLREAEAQQRKSCDTDVGGCGAFNGVNHLLERAPRVFTLQVQGGRAGGWGALMGSGGGRGSRGKQARGRAGAGGKGQGRGSV